MKHIFVFAGLSLGLLASPLAAQEIAQSAPVSVAPAPPPFPPMPSSKPSHRFVDMGDHRSRARSKASPVRHASSVKRDRKAHTAAKTRTHHTTSKNSKSSRTHKAASRRAVREAKPLHFSAKTVRSCHAMTYRQIMKSSSCRAMIKQELAAPAHKDRASKKASAKKRATRHSTAKKRRRR